MNISLRAGDRIYINGGVVRVDRKVNLELLNKVTFLLGSHVIQAEQANSPLRQIYFVIQMMLMDPTTASTAQTLAREMVHNTIEVFDQPRVVADLKLIDEQIVRRQYYDALKVLRGLFPVEGEILGVTGCQDNHHAA